MAKRTLLTEPHIYRQGGPRDSGTDTCRYCHQSFTTSWLHTDQALRFMDRVRRAEAERDRLAEQVKRVRALPTVYMDGVTAVPVNELHRVLDEVAGEQGGGRTDG